MRVNPIIIQEKHSHNIKNAQGKITKVIHEITAKGKMVKKVKNR